MLALSHALVVFASLLSSSASPVSPPANHFVTNIHRRYNKQGSPVPHDGHDIPIFDPTYARKEIKGILAKYEQASRFLLGMDLNQGLDLDISGLYPDNAPDTVINSVVGVLDDIDTSQKSPTSVPHVDIGWSIQPLRDHMSGTQDISYFGPLKLGTPAQALTFDIDTGSSDLWVPVNCTECANREFYSERSSTYQNMKSRFSITYGTGKASGTLASDIVEIGGASIRTYFGAVKQVSDDFNDSPSSGIHGMAFGSISASGKPTFFENLMAAKKVASPLFSVHLTRNQDTGSEVCFGCYDAAKAIGGVAWLPVVSKTYWTVQLDGLSAGAAANIDTDLTAAIDTGTTLIYLPDSVATQFYALIPGAKAAPRYGPAFFTFPCSSKLDVSFLMGGQSFSLNMYDFNLGKAGVGSPDCVGGIMSLGDGFPSNMAIIGDEFLKSWYSTYDYGHGARVGLSPSINNKQ